MIKSERGSITVFTLAACLLMIFILVGIFMGNQNKVINQKKQLQIIEENYNSDIENKMSEQYENILGKVEALTEFNATFKSDPETWTNGNVKVTVSTTVTGYTIQTSKDGENWENTSVQVYDANGIIYARLSNGENYGRSIKKNISNIDKTAPVVTSATADTTTITIKATDEASGIIGYAVTTSNTAPTSFKSCENTKSLSVSPSGYTQDTTYYVWVKDEAGNISEGKSTETGIIESATGGSYSPTTWTNGNVTVTLPTKSGFTTRYTTDGTKPTKDSTQYTSAFKVSSNCRIYYLYTDGTNIGGTGTLNVTNIDKSAPSATITLSSRSTYTDQTITATVTHTDTGTSGVNISKCKWIYSTSSTAIGTSASSYTGGTFSSNGQRITLSKTTPGTYYLHVLTTDNAGNVKETISSSVTVTQVYSLASKVSVGDYVSYNATDTYTYTSQKGSGTTHGNGHSIQTFTSSSSMKWRVLSKDTSTGEVVLISATPTEQYLKFYGVVMYLYAEQEINNICSIYGHGLGANTSKQFSYVVGDQNDWYRRWGYLSGARSLNLSDITGKLSVNLENTDANYGKNLYSRYTYYPTMDTDSGFSDTTAYRSETYTKHNFSFSSYVSTSSVYYDLFNCSNTTYAYLISSRCIMQNSYYTRYYVDKVRTDVQGIEANYLCDCSGSGKAEYGADVGLPLRPVVYLKPAVVTSGRDSSGSWILLDR